MEGGPLLSAWWKNSTQRFIPYLNISASLEDKPDQKMMDRYGLRGFPSFLILDAEGAMLFGKEPYWRPDTPENLDYGIAQVEPLLKLKKRVLENPKYRVAKAHLTLLMGLLDPGQANFEEMEAATQMKGVPAEVIGRWLRERVSIKFLEVFGPYRMAFSDRESKEVVLNLRQKAMDRAHQMVVAGERLDAEDINFRAFWVLAFDGAIHAENVESAGVCLKVYTETFGAQDRFLKEMREKYLKLGEKKEESSKKVPVSGS